MAELPRTAKQKAAFEQFKFKPGDPRAIEASRKSHLVRSELARQAKAAQPEAVPSVAVRVALLRRQQRVCLSNVGGNAGNPAAMLEAAKAARELFEMEMELLGRRPLKAGKVPRGATAEQTRKALALPDAATLPRPDSLDCAPPGYDPHAGLPFNPAGGNTSFTPLPLDPGATKQTAPRPAPGEQNRVAGIAQTVPPDPAPPTK